MRNKGVSRRVSTSAQKVDTPRKKRGVQWTDTPPKISLGKRERALLLYLNKNNNSRFNVKNYSRLSSIKRGTLYHIMDNLVDKGLIIKPHAGNHKITEKGKNTIEILENGGVHNLRRGCPDKANLSTHYHKFKLPIEDKSKFSINNISKMNPLGWHENKLFNLHQIIINFVDATIFINPKQLIINLYDISSEDVDESDFKSFLKAMDYVKLFMKEGIVTKGVILEEGHWARVESVLGDLLYEKVDNRYFLDLGDGKKFWIDHSFKREDESNDKVVREKVDNLISDVVNSDSSFKDIDKVIRALGLVSKIECAKLKQQIPTPQIEEDKPLKIERPNYVG